jgi:CCR4-NOT complex subunit CAF16
MKSLAIRVQDLEFSFESSTSPLFKNLNFEIPLGARVLLVGANGTGKSTLLKLLAGLHLWQKGSVEVFGSDVFRAPQSGTGWIGEDFQLNLDLELAEILGAERGSRNLSLSDSARYWLHTLELDLGWRMHQLSQGQRKRIQLFLTLQRGDRLLLLDEVTAHLDITIRKDFLQGLQKLSETRKTTIFYASHIFDSLHARETTGTWWFTHILWVGTQHRFKLLDSAELLTLQTKESTPIELSDLVDLWIRKNSVLSSSEN